MNFYDRYTAICTEKGIEPCSQKAAEAFGVTRATISVWNKKNTAPKGETVKVIADALGVSCDYLLGRTEDPTGLCAHPAPLGGGDRLPAQFYHLRYR